MVTIEGEFSQHFHGDQFVEHGETTITTTRPGSSGRNHDAGRDGPLLVFRQTDLLSNADGDRILARVVFAMDPHDRSHQGGEERAGFA